MRNVVIHIMHRNTRRVGPWTRRLARSTRIAQPLAIFRVDARLSRSAGPCSAAGAFGSELPVRAVGFVALCEEGECRACVGCWGGVATNMRIVSSCSFLNGDFGNEGLRCPTR
jgi:hypothetical protein